MQEIMKVINYKEFNIMQQIIFVKLYEAKQKIDI